MLFQVGKIKVSMSVLKDDSITVSDLIQAFDRYIKGDWGTADFQAELANDVALASGNRISATYLSRMGTEFCFTTDTGVTRISLRNEAAHSISS